MMIVVGYANHFANDMICALWNFKRACVALAEIPGRGSDPMGHRKCETKTGVTIMQIDAGLDTGDMLLKAAFDDWAGRNCPRIERAAGAVGRGLAIGGDGPDCRGRNPPARSRMMRKRACAYLNKEDGQVDWSRPAGEIYNRMRGFAPWPGAYTMFRGQQLTIFQARPVEEFASRQFANRKAPCAGRMRRKYGSGTSGDSIGGKKRMTAEAL